MTTIRVAPGAVSGRLHPPSSKSYTHRALILAFLGGGTGRVVAPLDSEDTRRTAEGLRRLGARVSAGAGAWTVRADRPVARGGGPVRVDCGESGTTLRLLACVAALGRRRVTFLGHGRLVRRPMRGLLAVLRRAGVEVTPPPDGRSLPFAVRGPLRPGSYDVPVSQTSQFLSGLLLALAFTDGSSTLRPKGRAVSSPYVQSTLAALARSGIPVAARRSGYLLSGSAEARTREFVVPGDASAAASLWALAGTSGGTVTVRGVDPSLPQTDLAVLGLLERMGARVERHADGATVHGPVVAPVRARLDASPDLLPALGALAACVDGPSVLRGAGQAAFKESDRRRGTERLARALGGSSRRSDGALWIVGHRPTRALRRERIHDHRMFMAATAGALAANGPSVLGDADCLDKSYPAFLRDLRRLGGEWEVVR